MSAIRLFVSVLFLLISICISKVTIANNDVTYIPKEVAEFFPSATRVVNNNGLIKAIEVYQLSQLLGFVFTTDELTNLIGFSGESINMRVALSTKGVILGISVISHNEPIFLHGLGEQVMYAFIDQFIGQSIKHRYSLRSSSTKAAGVTYIDGVTKATISVQVIKDTILSAALKIARETLPEFVQQTKKSIKKDYYRRQTLQQLIDNKFIHRWQLSYDQASKLWPEFTSNRLSDEKMSDYFIDLLIANMSLPIVAKNLLSDSEYQRLNDSLKQGESAFLVINFGDYDYIDENFIAQTQPNRLSIQQGELPVDIRDIDFYSFSDPAFTTELGNYSNVKLLRVQTQSGFDLSQPLTLMMHYNYSDNPLIEKSYSFTTQIKVNEQLFEENKLASQKPIPLWLTLWQQRKTEIILLILYLSLVVGVFFKQQSLSQSAAKMFAIRSSALLFCLFFIGFYAQGQLSVVNIYTLLLSIYKGFELTVFLLDPILFIVWTFTFVTVFLWGRGVFCGWLCPFGALQEMIAFVGKKLNIRTIRINNKWHTRAQLIKYLLLIILVLCSFISLTVAEQLAEIEPFKTVITLTFIREWPFVLFALTVLLLTLKIHKFYCRYICPLGAGLAILGKYPIFRWLTRRKECGNPCQLCKNKVCEIDAIKPSGDINYSECIQCFACIVVIQDKNKCVVNKYAKKQRAIVNTQLKKITD